MGAEFGHFYHRGGGICVDSWGAGPFILHHAGKTYRFEDSDRFGPWLVTKRGEPFSQQLGERSPFWRAHKFWRGQGRQLADDDETCVFECTVSLEPVEETV